MPDTGRDLDDGLDIEFDVARATWVLEPGRPPGPASLTVWRTPGFTWAADWAAPSHHDAGWLGIALDELAAGDGSSPSLLAADGLLLSRRLGVDDALAPTDEAGVAGLLDLLDRRFVDDLRRHDVQARSQLRVLRDAGASGRATRAGDSRRDRSAGAPFRRCRP